MKTNNSIDSIEYKDRLTELKNVIDEAFPEAVIVPVSNFDDFYHGYSICPHPGDLVEFKIAFGDESKVCIEKWEVFTYNNSVKHTPMFRGEFDRLFIVHLLKNYKTIG